MNEQLLGPLNHSLRFIVAETYGKEEESILQVIKEQRYEGSSCRSAFVRIRKTWYRKLHCYKVFHYAVLRFEGQHVFPKTYTKGTRFTRVVTRCTGSLILM